MSAANGRLEAYNVLTARDARLRAAQILREQMRWQEENRLTHAEEIALAHALSAFVDAERWMPE
jgi:hypothetical protein